MARRPVARDINLVIYGARLSRAICRANARNVGRSSPRGPHARAPDTYLYTLRAVSPILLYIHIHIQYCSSMYIYSVPESSSSVYGYCPCRASCSHVLTWTLEAVARMGCIEIKGPRKLTGHAASDVSYRYSTNYNA